MSKSYKVKITVNWCLVFLTAVNSKFGCSMSLSTIYNFITNSKNDTCGSAGLGESTTIYVITCAIFYGGSITGGLVMAALHTRASDYRRLFTIGPIIQILGGVLYALSTAGWMVILARFLVGINNGMTTVIAMSYFTVSAWECNKRREIKGLKMNMGLKKRLMLIFNLTCNLSHASSGLIVSVVSQFSITNQFNWIGWFEAGLSTSTTLLMLCLFNDNSSGCTVDKLQKENNETIQKPNTALSCFQIMVVLYLLITGYVTQMPFSIASSLTSQILNDHFGFSTKYISYFFTGVLVFYPLSSIILLLSQKFKLSSRMMLLGSLVLGTIGITILSDWQSIPFSECSNVLNTSETSHSTSYCPTQSCIHVGNMLSNNCPLLSVNDDYLMIYFYKSTGFTNQLDCPSCNSNNCWQYQLSGDELCKLIEDISTNKHTIRFESISLQGQPSNYSLCLSKSSPFITTNYNCSIELEKIVTAIEIANSASEEQKICESNQDCYWNPSSVITGEYCTECLPACLSKSGSLHFIQLCVGVFITLLAMAMCNGIVFPILSKVTPPHVQAFATSLLVFVLSLSNLITPLWMNTVYVLLGRHTYLLTSIVLVSLIPVYYGYFCILHAAINKHRPSNVASHIVESVPIPVTDDKEVESLSDEVNGNCYSLTVDVPIITEVNDDFLALYYETPL